MDPINFITKSFPTHTWFLSPNNGWRRKFTVTVKRMTYVCWIMWIWTAYSSLRNNTFPRLSGSELHSCHWANQSVVFIVPISGRVDFKLLHALTSMIFCPNFDQILVHRDDHFYFLFLRVELGRWARLPRAQRLCPCGSIQDEPYVLCVCPFTQPLRNSYGHAVIYPEVLHNATNLDDFRFIHDVLKYFE